MQSTDGTLDHGESLGRTANQLCVYLQVATTPQQLPWEATLCVQDKVGQVLKTHWCYVSCHSSEVCRIGYSSPSTEVKFNN
jgi:hypothetical protein